MSGKTAGVVAEDNRRDDDEPDERVVCTAIDNDWGDEQPNMLMHPPCACPRCAPDAVSETVDDGSWLQIPGQKHRRRVEQAELGAAGRDLLG